MRAASAVACDALGDACAEGEVVAVGGRGIEAKLSADADADAREVEVLLVGIPRVAEQREVHPAQEHRQRLVAVVDAEGEHPCLHLKNRRLLSRATGKAA